MAFYPFMILLITNLCCSSAFFDGNISNQFCCPTDWFLRLCLPQRMGRRSVRARRRPLRLQPLREQRPLRQPLPGLLLRLPQGNRRQEVRDCARALHRQPVLERRLLPRLRLRRQLLLPCGLHRNRLPVRVRRLRCRRLPEWSHLHRQRR